MRNQHVPSSNLLFLKTDVNVPTVSNKQKIFVGILKATEEKSRIQIRNPVVRIRGSGSVSKRLGSKTPIPGYRTPQGECDSALRKEYHMVFLNFSWNLNFVAHLKFVPGFPPG
jgi:hypothetical protein